MANENVQSVNAVHPTTACVAQLPSRIRSLIEEFEGPLQEDEGSLAADPNGRTVEAFVTDALEKRVERLRGVIAREMGANPQPVTAADCVAPAAGDKRPVHEAGSENVEGDMCMQS